MPEIIQDLNQPQLNPLKTDDLESTDITPANSKKKLVLTPKIVLLAVLGGIIVILLIMSLFVTASKSAKKPTPTVKTSPTPAAATATPNPEVIVIPTQYQTQMNDIDKSIQEKVDFPIPQTDPNIGLTPNQ